MAWKPEDIQERNKNIRCEFENGANKSEFAKKYNLSIPSIVNIINKNREPKRWGDINNTYTPIKLKPGQVVKLKVGETKAIRTVKYKVIKNYPNYVLMERLGIMGCFLHFDIWRGVVCGEVLN